MKAIILAAGRGSRMKSKTDYVPKCLLELKGRPLLDIQVAALLGAGIDEIGIVTGYKRELLASRGLVEFHNSRWSDTNMLTSLSCADEWLTKEACVISYSDIFYESSAISLLQNSQAELAITYDKSWLDHWANRFEDPLSDAETFVLNESGNLADIGGKAKSVEEIEGQYMGLLRVTPASWTEIQQIRSRMNRKSRDDMHLTGMLREILFRGSVVIEALAYTGSWGEIDTTTDWEHYNRATDQS